MEESGHIIQIYKSRINILEILKSQGYNVSNYEGSGINEVNSLFLSNQMSMLLHKNDESKKAYITYHFEKTLSQKNINEYIEDLFTIDKVLEKKDDFIIIINDEPNDSLIKMIRNIWEQDHIYINIFNIKRLQYNILKHELVPPHFVLTNEEATEVKKKYNITDEKTQLPDISRFDPVAQAICIRPGEICRIERPSKTSIISNYYRICLP
jgi:DNA-directed RNA polymerase I, II, and III subunit RPABC1